MEEILDVISLALNVYNTIRILKEKKSIFRSSVSSVDIVLFSLFRQGEGKIAGKMKPLVFKRIFSVKLTDEKNTWFIFFFSDSIGCVSCWGESRDVYA